MKEVVQFIPLDLAKRQAALHVGSLGIDEDSAITILQNYRDSEEQELFRGISTLRCSHDDIWNFCIYTGLIPESLCIQDTIMPPNGMDGENRRRLEYFFLENRKTIIDRIFSDINSGRLKISDME